MATYVALRALHRGIKIRVTTPYHYDPVTGASDGSLGGGAPYIKQTLASTYDTIVDLDIPANRRALAHHSALGQFIVTGTSGDPVHLLTDPTKPFDANTNPIKSSTTNVPANS